MPGGKPSASKAARPGATARASQHKRSKDGGTNGGTSPEFLPMLIGNRESRTADRKAHSPDSKASKSAAPSQHPASTPPAAPASPAIGKAPARPLLARWRRFIRKARPRHTLPHESPQQPAIQAGRKTGIPCPGIQRQPRPSASSTGQPASKAMGEGLVPGSEQLPSDTRYKIRFTL